MKLTNAFAFAWLILCLPTSAQNRREYPQRPEAADRITRAPKAASKTVYRTSPAQLQREAREILDLAQALQVDINDASRGLLPKDAGDKLKRIESLAKRLRSEIGR